MSATQVVVLILTSATFATAFSSGMQFLIERHRLRVNAPAVARSSEREDERAEVDELRGIIAEQRGLIDTYRSERSGDRGRIEHLESVALKQAEDIALLQHSDRECKRLLASAQAQLKSLGATPDGP